ncbi:hypothetical protein [Cryptosporangium sp. NPDC051539]|uniref:hypothetical protein n=1 Tax=Cryptosporangium sp. NPDC051539 TaxID=3363962 RepID=UPI0037B5779E
MDDDSPRSAAVLAEMNQLKTRSRRLAHGGAWLPALALAAVPLASIALYRHPFSSAINSGTQAQSPDGVTIEYPYWAGLPEQQHSALASYLFWLVLAPLTFVLVAQWYRRRESRRGVRVNWRIPIAAGGAGLLALLALLAAPTGTPAAFTWWHGPLTPLLSIALAAIALGFAERSIGVAVAGLWLGALAWQFCATGFVGGLLGWQDWLLAGGSGPALGGQLGLGLDRPALALLVMTLPLVLVGAYRAVRFRGQLT